MPSSFRTPLYLEFQDDGIWRLTAPFEFASKETESIIRVPADFLTDFASVPQVFWNILPPTGRYGKAAVIHDWLYQTRNAGTHLCTRSEADSVLREGMDALGIDQVTRWTIYTGIRVGGWAAWHNYRKLDKL